MDLTVYVEGLAVPKPFGFVAAGTTVSYIMSNPQASAEPPVLLDIPLDGYTEDLLESSMFPNKVSLLHNIQYVKTKAWQGTFEAEAGHMYDIIHVRERSQLSSARLVCGDPQFPDRLTTDEQKLLLAFQSGRSWQEIAGANIQVQNTQFESGNVGLIVGEGLLVYNREEAFGATYQVNGIIQNNAQALDQFF